MTLPPWMLRALIAALMLGTVTAHADDALDKVRAEFRAELDALLDEIKAARERDTAMAEELAEHAARLDAIEAQEPAGEIIEPPDPPPLKVPAALPVVTLWTADSSWTCAPCEKQKRWLRDNPPTFKYSTVAGPRDGVSPSGKYPCWQVQWPDGTTEVKGGTHTVEQLNQWVQCGPNPATSSVDRYTRDELRAWVHEHYSEQSQLQWGIEPPLTPWEHLQHGIHGFTTSQVTGLKHWEAMALHDAHHREFITPFRGSARAIRMKPPAVVNRPAYAHRGM